jgi:hypothetical protein
MKIASSACLFICITFCAFANNDFEELCKEVQKIRFVIPYIQQLISTTNVNQVSIQYGQTPLILLAMNKFCNKEEQEEVALLLVEVGAVQNRETKESILDLARTMRDDHRNGIINPLQEIKDSLKLQ